MVELHGVERLESVVEELLAPRSPRAASDDAPSTTAIWRRSPALRRGDEAPSGGIGVPGLHAVDVRIDPQEPVAVRLRDVVVAEFLQRIERIVVGEVADHRRGERREVARGRVMVGLRKPGDVDEIRVREPHALRLGVHARDELRLAARDELGERDRRVVAGLHDHPVHQLVDRHRAARLDEHPRAFGVPCGGRHRHALRRRDLAFAQRGEHEIRGHELGERRGIAPLVGVLRDDRRAAREIEQHVARAPRSQARVCGAAAAAAGAAAARPRCAGRKDGGGEGRGEDRDETGTSRSSGERVPIITSSTARLARLRHQYGSIGQVADDLRVARVEHRRHRLVPRPMNGT